MCPLQLGRSRRGAGGFAGGRTGWDWPGECFPGVLPKGEKLKAMAPGSQNCSGKLLGLWCHGQASRKRRAMWQNSWRAPSTVFPASPLGTGFVPRAPLPMQVPRFGPGLSRPQVCPCIVWSSGSLSKVPWGSPVRHHPQLAVVQLSSPRQQ